MPRSRLLGALALAEVEAAPASPEAFAVCMDRLFSFVRTFGIKNGGGEQAVADAVRFYREGLSDVPADLLDEAVSGVIKTYVWGHRLPTPADLRDLIAEKLAKRRADRYWIENAIGFGRDPAPKIERKPEDEEKIRKQIEALASDLRTGKAGA